MFPFKLFLNMNETNVRGKVNFRHGFKGFFSCGEASRSIAHLSPSPSSPPPPSAIVKQSDQEAN